MKYPQIDPMKRGSGVKLQHEKNGKEQMKKKRADLFIKLLRTINQTVFHTFTRSSDELRRRDPAEEIDTFDLSRGLVASIRRPFSCLHFFSVLFCFRLRYYCSFYWKDQQETHSRKCNI